ncbi:iron ABC transporter permease [Clostridium sp.]|uniref:FecCD family ABC transporter permease n=1 Tax=Clostridium sp. TaxID=1506 RepID=UPI00260CC971|nr:iron ABC transporter permease [Clostridium sp.]
MINIEPVCRLRLRNRLFRNNLNNNFKDNIILGSLIILLIILFLLSFTIGNYSVSLPELIKIFIGKIFNLQVTWDVTIETALFNIRIPRILTAILIGAALAASGAVYQGLFKNPMVSPDVLGVSAGSGFGAAIAILLSWNIVGIQLSSLLIGLAAVSLTYFIGKFLGRGNSTVLILILTGMVISAMFSSFISVAKYVADPETKLPAITFWLMGSLSSIRNKDLIIFIFPFVFGIIPLFLMRWRLNLLSFGEEEAQAMGIDTNKTRIVIIICSTLLTASSISICGEIGWIGLIIPHIARFMVGSDYKKLLPVSMLIGSIFLLLVDDIARGILINEVPLGILTSLIGAPFFFYLLLKSTRGNFTQ